MTLFNAKDAVKDVKQAVKDKPRKPNRFQQMAADNKTLRDENGRLRARVSGLEARVSSLESFQSEQESFNAGTQQRVGKLQRQSAADDVPCPGCGQPSGVGTHGVWCFQAADGG